MRENELYCESASKDTLGVTSQSVSSTKERKDHICLYSGKSCVNTKVSLLVTDIAGDIPAHTQLENMAIHASRVQKWQKTTPGRRF